MCCYNGGISIAIQNDSLGTFAFIDSIIVHFAPVPYFITALMMLPCMAKNSMKLTQ